MPENRVTISRPQPGAVSRVLLSRFAAACAVSLALAACNKPPATVPPPNQAAAASSASGIEFAASDLARAERRPMVPSVALSGTLRPWQEATVKAKVAGELLTLAVREGDAVRAGQVLGHIEAADYQARLRGLEADIAAAEANLAIAERNRVTQESLLARGFVSRTAFDTTLAARDAAAARLDAAKQAAVIGRKAFADTTLVAPIAGRIAARLMQPGERVPVDGRIVTIADVSRLELAASLSAADASRLRVGAELSVQVDVPDAAPLKGRIERINPAAAAGTRAIEVYATLDNPGERLRGGLFAQGRARAGQPGENVVERVVVPASAVREEAGHKVLYVVVGDVLSRRVVSVLDGQDGVIAITEGIAVGETLVRFNLGPMKDGVAVKVAPSRSAETAPPGIPLISADPAAAPAAR